jgi:hypothetical protein
MSISIRDQFSPIQPEIEGPGPDAPEPDVAPPPPPPGKLVADELDALAGNVGQAIQAALDQLQTAKPEPKPIPTDSGDGGCSGTAQKEPPKELVFDPTKVDINIFI